MLYVSAQKECSERHYDRLVDLVIFFIKELQENGAQEDGHVPGLRQVPGMGHQVRVLGFERKRLQDQSHRKVKAEMHSPQRVVCLRRYTWPLTPGCLVFMGWIISLATKWTDYFNYFKGRGRKSQAPFSAFYDQPQNCHGNCGCHCVTERLQPGCPPLLRQH